MVEEHFLRFEIPPAPSTNFQAEDLLPSLDITKSNVMNWISMLKMKSSIEKSIENYIQCKEYREDIHSRIEKFKLSYPNSVRQLRLFDKKFIQSLKETITISTALLNTGSPNDIKFESHVIDLFKKSHKQTELQDSIEQIAEKFDIDLFDDLPKTDRST